MTASDEAILHRLNGVIALLVALLVLLLWPVLSGLAFLTGAVLVLAVGGALVWTVSRQRQ